MSADARPLRAFGWPRLLVAVAGSVLAATSCGGRGEPLSNKSKIWLPLPVLDAGPDYCLTESDCQSDDRCEPRRCVDNRCVSEPIVCDDGDPCTSDVCNSRSGECSFTPLTVDRDGDGFPPPRPGFSRLDPAACGSDCDDTSAQAFPGNREVCDGLDNDCDGVVDNGARFVADPTRVIDLSSEAITASTGGIAYSDQSYGVVFSQQTPSARNMQNTFASILPDRTDAPAPVRIALVPNDTFAGPIVWTGQVFASVWEDRRDDDYEIYFNRLNQAGNKLDPDHRLTQADGFSLRPSISFDGVAEFRVAWDDRRDGLGYSIIYGQRLGLSGEPIGQNVAITPTEFESISPMLASGEQRLGMVFMALRGDRRVAFRSYAHDFSDPGAIVTLSGPDAAAQSMTYNRGPSGGRFIAAWHIEGQGDRPGPSIHGAVVSENGDILVPERPLTEPADFARSHALLPLGDRVILFWAQSVDAHYDIYARELSPELEPLGEASRVTQVATQAYGPSVAVGREGEIGVLFHSKLPDDGRQHVFFTSLACAAVQTPR
jgi:hypothetical protein